MREHFTWIPKVITVGIGCKKNTPAGRIEEKVLAARAAAGISPKAVRQAASIDLKAQEPRILQLLKSMAGSGPDLFCRRTGNGGGTGIYAVSVCEEDYGN